MGRVRFRRCALKKHLISEIRTLRWAFKLVTELFTSFSTRVIRLTQQPSYRVPTPPLPFVLFDIEIFVLQPFRIVRTVLFGLLIRTPYRARTQKASMYLGMVAQRIEMLSPKQRFDSFHRWRRQVFPKIPTKRGAAAG